MTTTPHVLATGPLLQAWSNAGAITANDDWSGVPGIVGYLGQEIASGTGADPQTLTADSSLANDVDVIANQTNPNTLGTGGVAEFALSDPTIALQGSGTADAPHLVLYLDATGRRDVVVAFNARDIDGSSDNAVQPIAVQYRVDAGAWKNLPAGYVADATTQGSATQVTPVSVTLPAEANGAAGLQVRIITANAVGNDEWVGIDDIAVSSQGAATSLPALSIADAQVTEGQAGQTNLTVTVSLSAPAPAGGVTFDVATADGTARAGSDYLATTLAGRTIAAGATATTISVPVNGDTLAEGNETFGLRVTNVVGATVADGEATGTILNDDASGVINGVAVLNAAPSLQGAQGATATAPPVATDALQLVRLGGYATTNDPATSIAANAEVVAYDRTTGSLYIQNTNENRIEIVGIGADGGMAKSGEIRLAGLEQYGSVNSVAVFDGLVAIAYANATGDQPGRVALFDKAGTLLKSVSVGIGPDQIVFTGDGTKLLVANEGEQFTSASNPVGSVSILDLSRGAAAAGVSATVGFDALNGSEAALRAKGLAITPGKSAAADIEPEYIALSPDNRFAYVTLQEVNGIAVIDLANPGTAPIAIQPLGSVDHSLPGNEFDASDRDGPGGTASIRIAATPANAPIYGLLQPDAAASFAVNGATYVVTANEGDQRVIGGADDGADVARLSGIADGRLTPELQALKADPAYARLNVLLRSGDTNNDGVIDQLNTLGGRGISIFRQEADGALTKVRETGGEFEKIFASLAPARFNNDQTVANTPDDRSDNKGPEPEGVTIGTVAGRTYAFVGLERQSGVIVYDVTDPAKAAYVSYVPPLSGVSADLGPEVLTFISADRNPTGTPLLVTANEAGGGATLYAALPQGYTQSLAFQAGSLAVAKAESDTGTTSFAFTVERTGGTLGSLAFTAELAGTGADGADFAGAPTLPATIAGTIPAGATSATITVTVQGDVLPEVNEGFTVTLKGASAGQSGVTAALATTGTVATGTILNDDVTLISAVQGAGAASPLAGRTVTVEAIVVGDFQTGDADAKRNLGGVFLQEEAGDQDGNPLTSEGVFVYEGAGNLLRDVQEGDRVRVTGTVGEFGGETQITVTDAAGIQVVQAGAVSAAALKAAATVVDLPAAATIGTGTTAQPDLERYEGMLVKVGQTLTITEQFNLDRFNEIRLAAGGRPETFTNAFEPNAAGYAAYLAQVAARSITYDDGLNVQNQPVDLLDGFGPAYSTASAPRMGDTVTGLTGVLGYGPANAYRVRAIDDGDNAVAHANPRAAAPDAVGGSLTVGSLNVLNYFRTLDSDGTASGVKTAIGLDPRGANTQPEFDRQTQKLVSTVIASGADVFGLTELENQFQPGNPGNALEYLVGQLNARAGAGTYDWVRPGAALDRGQFLGGDAIAVGFVYKPGKVSVALNTTIETLDDSDVQAFDPALLQQSTIGHLFNGANTSRAALAVTFRENATGEDFTAVINHLKSKSGAGTGADADQGDGQGGWQQQRELAATALTKWLALKPTGTPDGDVVLLGDFNAYVKEDALDVLKAGGFTNLAEDRLANPYSYVFDGAYGALDHALANASLNRQVTGVTEWHINADEADAIDYNLDFGRSAADFDGLIPARESDHDPILVGLRLDQTAAPRQFVGVDPLGSVTIPNGTRFEGTLVGGLSGLTRTVDGTYLAMSDDKSAARAYGLDIDLADGRLDAGDVQIRAVTRLTGTGGAAFPPSDPEGIAAAADGSFYVSSEGSNRAPFITHFSAAGAEIGTVALPDILTRGYEFNRGIESLALTPNGRFLFTGTEHPLTPDAGTAFAGGLPSRIFAFDTASGRVAHQFVYTIDDFGADGRTDDNGLVDLIALDDTHLLALERVFVGGRGNSIRLYEVDTKGATDVSAFARLAEAGGSAVPVQKTLLANLGFVPDFLAGTGAFVAPGSPDNIEGMVLGPRLDDGRQSILLIADNNFRSDTRQITNVVALGLTPGANTAPAFSDLDGAPSFVPGGPAVVLDADATVADPELDRANAGRGDYRGATLTIARDGGASAQDAFGGTTALAALTEGGDLRYAGARIGTVAKNSDGILKLAFDGQATSAAVDGAIQGITYKNSGPSQASSLKLNYEFDDGLAGSSGINKVEVKIQPMTYTLQILHASDWEAGLLATQRAANFAAIVDKLEDSTPNSITLSTGDGWIPSPFFIAGADPQLAATYNGVYNQLYGLTGSAAYTKLAASVGRADITIQNIIGVQAAVFGNHEFDSGPTEVANIIGANLGPAAGNADDTWVGAQFPYLSANLNFSREAALSGLVNPNVSSATFAQTGPTSTQTGTGADKIAKSTILVENGEKIAFVGATTQLEPLLTTLGNVTLDGFNGQDNIALLASQINAEVDRVLSLNPDVNKVIVGTHLQQLANEQALAPLLRNVDVLIGGGSHTLLADGDDRLLPGDTAGGGYPQFHTNASGQTLALVNTASEYAYVGRLTVTFDDQGNVIRDSVNPATSGAVAVDDATVAQLYGSTAAAFTPGAKGFLVREVIEGLDADNDGVQETAGIADVIRQQDGNILGRSSVYLEGRRGEVRTEETNLGDLSSDANLWYARQFDAGVTVSIKNGGGIRDSIGSFSTAGGGTSELPPTANPSAGKQAGDISQLDVTNSLRFNNNLAVVTVTAAELERVLEHGVAAVAPGATPGQFSQVGGISYSFDATKQAQTLDVNGKVTREGQRIVNAAIIDADGRVLDTLVQNGQVVGDANRAIKVVTLDFLATGTASAPGLGGDNYPFPAYGENKIALRDAAPVSLPDTETFAVKGSEQDALAEYLKAFHATTPYGTADTGPAGDLRIQNLAARADTVLQRGVLKNGTPEADTLRGTAFSDILNGGAGDDIVYNSAGDDIFTGGAGPGGATQADTLIFATKLMDAQVWQEGDFTIVSGPEGRDAVNGFERIQFSDVTIDLADGNRLVDDLFYLARNKDVLAAGQDADAHYAAYGAAEGRDPNAFFSTKGYLATYTDVAQAKQNPLTHYDTYGWKEGRDPGAGFDTQFYLARNGDVKAAGIDPLTHYLEYGQAEGRAIFDAVGFTANIKGGFDPEFYLLANADVAQAATAVGGDIFAFARQHYDTYGWKDGRDPNAVFDTKGYLAAYGDVAAAGVNPLSHYDTYGWKEGRDPARDFDTSTYLAVNGDVAQAGIDPLQHFLQYGLIENRSVLVDGTFGAGTLG